MQSLRDWRESPKSGCGHWDYGTTGPQTFEDRSQNGEGNYPGLDYIALAELAARHGRSSAGNVSLRDDGIRQGEPGHGNSREDHEIFHGQGVAHDQFERGEILKGR